MCCISCTLWQTEKTVQSFFLIVTLFKTINYELEIFIYPSICCSRVEAEQDVPDVLLPSKTFQLLLSDPTAFPGQMRHMIPGSAPRSPSSGSCPENLRRESPTAS